jgi:hypothetical protein
MNIESPSVRHPSGTVTRRLLSSSLERPYAIASDGAIERDWGHGSQDMATGRALPVVRR